MGVCRPIELAPQQASLRDGRACKRIDGDVLHLRDVDHNPIVDKSGTGNVMAPCSNGRVQIILGCEPDRTLDVLDTCASKNGMRTAIDHGVPDLPGGVVAGAPGRDNLTPEL